MSQFFKKMEKSYFWYILAYFFHFGGKNIFSKNPALSHTTSYGFLIPCQNLEKTIDPIPRKRLDVQTDRLTDSILHNLQATTSDLKTFNEYITIDFLSLLCDFYKSHK